jgi:hypothetical protein
MVEETSYFYGLVSRMVGTHQEKGKEIVSQRSYLCRCTEHISQEHG